MAGGRQIAARTIPTAEHLPFGDLVKDLDVAKREVPFSRAVGIITHALPPSLLIAGHNPLDLLAKGLNRQFRCVDRVAR